MFQFRDDGILFVRVTEGPPAASLWAAMSDGRFRPGMPILIDRRQVPVPSPDYVRRIEAWWRAHGAATGSSPIAILATSPAAYGMARMTEILLDDGIRSVHVFKEEEPALDWLRAQAAET